MTWEELVTIVDLMADKIDPKAKIGSKGYYGELDCELGDLEYDMVQNIVWLTNMPVSYPEPD